MGYEWDIPIKGGWVTCPLGSCEKKTCWLNTKKTMFLYISMFVPQITVISSHIPIIS
jgi:hypothetical protein